MSPYQVELDAIADLRVAVLLADAMSLALLPRLHGAAPAPARPEGGAGRTGYVLNQIDQRRQLCRDVLALSEDVLGDQLFGTVHRDEAVAEAVACQLAVLDYAPDSIASHDMIAVARRLDGSLRTV